MLYNVVCLTNNSKQMIAEKVILPRGTRYKLVELTGLSLNVIDNHIYGKYHNEKVEKAILKLLKRKR